MTTGRTGSEATGPGRPDTPLLLPLRPLLVLGLALAPFSFFANPPGWVLALMMAPDAVPLCRPPSRKGGRRQG